MEIRFNKDDAKEKLRIICQVAGSKILEILSAVKLSKKGNVLEMYATNSVIYVSTSMKLTGNDNSEGSIIINAEELGSLVDSAPDNDIVLKDDEKSITFMSGRFKARLSKLPIKDYPDFKIELGEAVKLDLAFLKDTIEKNMIFVAKANEGLAVMTGVSMGNGYSISTNRFAVTVVKSDRLSFGKVVIPMNVLNIIKNIKSDNDKEAIVQVGVKDNAVVFKYEDTLLMGRLIEGQYPDVVSMVEKFKANLTLKVKRQEILGMIKRAKLLFSVAEMESSSVKIKVGKIRNASVYHVIFTDKEGQETAESYPCISWDGEEFECSFNMFYIENAISLTKKDEVCMKLGMPNEEGRKMPLIVEEDDYRAVILAVSK